MCGRTWSGRTTPSPSSPRRRSTPSTPTSSSVPAGSGKRAAARAFAALLLSAGSEGEDAERHVRLALAETHPDLHIVEATTAQGRIDAPTARQVVKQAALSPAEGSRKVLVLEDFHLIDQFGAILLKYVEEPPASTFFVILAEDVPPELVTIASRSVRIDFGPVPLAAVIERLVAEGVDRAARRVRRGGGRRRSRPGPAAGDRRALRRAGRGAAGDARPAERDRVPGPPRSPARSRRSSTTRRPSSTLATSEEAAELEERIERYGQRGSGKKDIQDRHKREVRRHRTAELRLALATFAGVYRDALIDARHPAEVVDGHPPHRGRRPCRSSASRTSRCSCRPSSPSSRPSTPSPWGPPRALR